MIAPVPLTCPLCGRIGAPDERPEAEIGGVMFRSITCDAPPASLTDHPFATRWLETHVRDERALQDFREAFARVRGPLEEGTPIAEAFGDTDPIRAWIEDGPDEDGFRVLIRI